MDSIQQSYPEYMYTTWKTGRLSGLKITLLTAPSRSPSGVMRCSSLLTATAGLRWIWTIFPFNGGRLWLPTNRTCHFASFFNTVWSGWLSIRNFDELAKRQNSCIFVIPAGIHKKIPEDLMYTYSRIMPKYRLFPARYHRCHVSFSLDWQVENLYDFICEKQVFITSPRQSNQVELMEKWNELTD